MRHTSKHPFNAQLIDRRLMLLLEREGTKTMEHLTAQMGLGTNPVLFSVDRLSRKGKVSLTLVHPFECRVSLTRPAC